MARPLQRNHADQGARVPALRGVRECHPPPAADGRATLLRAHVRGAPHRRETAHRVALAADAPLRISALQPGDGERRQLDGASRGNLPGPVRAGGSNADRLAGADRVASALATALGHCRRLRSRRRGDHARRRHLARSRRRHHAGVGGIETLAAAQRSWQMGMALDSRAPRRAHPRHDAPDFHDQLLRLQHVLRGGSEGAEFRRRDRRHAARRAAALSPPRARDEGKPPGNIRREPRVRPPQTVPRRPHRRQLGEKRRQLQ